VNLGSFGMLLPFFRTSWCVGVLNSAIFSSFHNRVQFGTILEGLQNFGEGGLNTPNPPLVRHWTRARTVDFVLERCFYLKKVSFIVEFLKFNFNAFLLYGLVVLSSPVIDQESPSSSAKPLIDFALFDEVNTIRRRLHTKREVDLRLCNL
jgi:hypothetical protein